VKTPLQFGCDALLNRKSRELPLFLPHAAPTVTEQYNPISRAYIPIK